MNRVFLFTFLLFAVACGTTTSSTSYDSAEEEMYAILEKDGWTQISNCTNVYRLDTDHSETKKTKKIQHKTTYWYTASIFSRQSGPNTKYIIARVVYTDREEAKALRKNGNLVYKTFPIIDCAYTDKYNRNFNGYILDGGATAYLNY